MTYKILDTCCGSRMCYFDKNNPLVLFGDIRKENHILCDGRKLNIKPDIQFDFRALPFKKDSFQMVVFDPPHLFNLGKNSWMFLKYGGLSKTWEQDLKTGFSECFRVLKEGGTLIFKWNEDQIPVSRILKLTDHVPVIGNRSGKRSKTHWISSIKIIA